MEPGKKEIKYEHEMRQLKDNVQHSSACLPVGA